MQITILLEKTEESLTVDISDELSLNDLKVLIEAETEIPAKAQVLVLDNRLLTEGELTVSQAGIAHNGLILLRNTLESHGGSIASDRFIQNKDEGTFENKRPEPLGQSGSTNDRNSKRANNNVQGLADSAIAYEVLKKLQEYPDDADSQTKILELIRQNQIEENLQLAYDISPESFVPVNLLYIKLRINGHEAYALVDTGAQKTIIHPKLAEKFGISNLIDKRFATMTIGVGTQHSEGVIHSVPVGLSDLNLELPCSFVVLDIHVGILFGLDMLRRHKCSVELAKDALVIGDKEINFLTDHEIETLVLPFQNINGLSEKSQAIGPLSPQKVGEVSVDHEKNNTQNSIPKNSSVESSSMKLSISKIMSLGFSEEEAIEALRLANGNVELAASSLF
ncbi:hypothetical protein JCM33374_g6385 [Metschnikowia sp. JCM 33374]|nr:hypothetical protein JCM33374_g6385 [Metschnikowia sp. JCM 33374]